MQLKPARALALLLPLLLSSAAAAADESTQGLRYPSLTPDGKSVVFCYRGDIWIAPRDGKGPAQRLTIHEEQDTLCRVSPDGKEIAFTSSRSGNYEIYVMPVTGGEPKQVTFHSGVDIVCEWSPDGKRLLVASNRDLGDAELDLYELNLAGGTPRRLTFDGAREGSYSPDGTRVVYARGFNTIYWDNYTGSADYDLHVVDVKGGIPLRLTDTPGNERWPFFSADGRRIRFVAEEKGVADFYEMPAEGGERKQLTKYTEDVQRPDLAWDGKTMAFELVGRLYVTDLDAPAEKPTPLPLDVRSDVRDSGLELRTITSGGEHVHVSADGRQIAFSLRGDVWVMPANGGEGRQVTSGPGNDQWPRWSPDGQRIAYFSDKAGKNGNDIYVVELRTGATAQVTNAPRDDFFQNWSPDGKRLVFCSDRTGNKEIWVVDLESQQQTQLTNDEAADDDPSFSPDGKLVAFDSGRGGSQAIYVMNADGSGVRRVSGGGGFFQVPSFSPDGRMLVFESMNPGTGTSGGLYVVSVSGGQAMQISEDGSGACWSPVGDYIYFSAERGQEAGAYRVAAPKGVFAGERIPFIGRVQVDLRKELENLFDEAWTALKNGFYDPKMHGVDWEAMRKKYRAWAIDAENKDEFHNVVRQMLAELGASHLGIGGGPRSRVAPATAPTGYLGLDFGQDPEESGARRVVRVLPQGPADGAGMRVGDIVTKINGTELKADTNLDKLLAGTVGRQIPVGYRPRTAAGLEAEKTVQVSPLPAGRVAELLYDDWVQTCRRRVEDATRTKDGEVGYIHLNQMNGPNLQRFVQTVQQWASNPKIKGMILDVRNNGGGNIHQQLMQILISRPLARVTLRGRDPGVQPDTYWDRPVTLLINERSFSDAEVFPFMFREAKCGKIVGVPTAGGVIGTNDITLSDGSMFRVPRTGFQSMDGKNLEGLGVPPDIHVEETSEDRLSGRDPQLAKAIEVVLAEIAEREKAAPKKPEPEPKAEAPKEQPSPAPPPDPTAGALNPLGDARPGEWVRYRATGDDGAETILKVTVTRVDGGEVFFAKEIEKGPPSQAPFPERMARKGLLDLLPQFGEVLGHSVVHGKVRDADAEIVEARVRWPDGSEISLHFSNAVPAYGLLRVEAGKRIVVEAIEWGEPAAAEAKAEETPTNPVFDAQVGEWVRVRIAGRGGETVEMIRRVVGVADDEVTILWTLDGESREEKRPRTRLLAPMDGSAATYGHERVTVAGKELDCVVMTFTRAGAEEKAWFSNEVPVTGVVRHERSGTVLLELLDWGKD
ncbi:MAG: S41 family peptidase [Planctomycetes bacterium]|nr:S41 family peptidase [Planctomycetota bacterium]